MTGCKKRKGEQVEEEANLAGRGYQVPFKSLALGGDFERSVDGAGRVPSVHSFRSGGIMGTNFARVTPWRWWFFNIISARC